MGLNSDPRCFALWANPKFPSGAESLSLTLSEQHRQPREICRHAPCLVARENTGLSGHVVVIAEIEIPERLPVGVIDAERAFGFGDRPRRREPARRRHFAAAVEGVAARATACSPMIFGMGAATGHHEQRSPSTRHAATIAACGGSLHQFGPCAKFPPSPVGLIRLRKHYNLITRHMFNPHWRPIGFDNNLLVDIELIGRAEDDELRRLSIPRRVRHPIVRL
jgi:hypothetical protein